MMIIFITQAGASKFAAARSATCAINHAAMAYVMATRKTLRRFSSARKLLALALDMHQLGLVTNCK